MSPVVFCASAGAEATARTLRLRASCRIDVMVAIPEKKLVVAACNAGSGQCQDCPRTRNRALRHRIRRVEERDGDELKPGNSEQIGTVLMTSCDRLTPSQCGTVRLWFLKRRYALARLKLRPAAGRRTFAMIPC